MQGTIYLVGSTKPYLPFSNVSLPPALTLPATGKLYWLVVAISYLNSLGRHPYSLTP